MTGTVLGIDPGTRKVGFALVDGHGEVLAQGIEEPEHLGERLARLTEPGEIVAIALGAGTNSHLIRAELADLAAPIHLVDESATTLAARSLYFAAHPPRGWRRLLPLGMQMPPRPIDDYAAILIARRFLERGRQQASS